MRNTAESELGVFAKFYSVKGAAEATSLRDGSIDIITVAEAYHWFDNELTITEFRRILKKGCLAILLWNNFDKDAFIIEKDKFFEKFRKHKKHGMRFSRKDRTANLFGVGNFKYAEFNNSITQTFDKLLGGLVSASYTPDIGDPDYYEFESGLKALFDRYSKDGLLKSPITTVCFYGNI